MDIFEAIEADVLDEVKKEVKELIAKDPNLLNNMKNKSGYSPLMCAINNRKYEIIDYLLTVKEINVNKSSSGGVTPLLMAIRVNTQTAYTLLEHKNIDINKPSSKGSSSYIGCSNKKKKNLVHLLLKEGAEIDAIKTPEGRTALHEAAYQGDEGLVEKVLKYKPNIEAKDKYGETPLHLAAFRGHTEVVNLLLEKGANIEAKNKFGYTALHLAAYFGELEVATALIEKEENKKEVNQNQKTPLHLAAQEGHAAIVIRNSNKEAVNHLAY